MVTNLKNTLSALLLENNMSFHWDPRLKQWWLTKDKPDDLAACNEFFNAADIAEALQSAYLYLKSLSEEIHPTGESPSSPADRW
jgi:hypothetical protein